MVVAMQRYLKWLAAAALMLSLNSCGLPGAVMRSTGNLAQKVAALR
jgi:hypothetical protein